MASASANAFRDWPTIFPNATCATARIGRVVHHADVIAIEGDSYRAREASQSVKVECKEWKTDATTTTAINRNAG